MFAIIILIIMTQISIQVLLRSKSLSAGGNRDLRSTALLAFNPGTGAKEGKFIYVISLGSDIQQEMKRWSFIRKKRFNYRIGGPVHNLNIYIFIKTKSKE